MFGRTESDMAIGRAFVSTTSSRSAGRASASRAVVVPASSRIDPSSGSSASANRAIRSFSAVRTLSRAARAGSKPSRSIGIAPPWTRRRSAWRSSVVRSRRTVSVVTPSSSASAATSTRPPARARSTIQRWRSSAYMLARSCFICVWLYIAVFGWCQETRRAVPGYSARQRRTHAASNRPAVRRDGAGGQPGGGLNLGGGSSSASTSATPNSASQLVHWNTRPPFTSWRSISWSAGA